MKIQCFNINFGDINMYNYGFSIGNRINELRTKYGLSQLQLATSSDITSAYLSLLERDEKNPTVFVLSKICEALNISLKEFFDIEYDIENNATINQIIYELKLFSIEEQEEILNIIKHISKLKTINK
jgi:transcriptional regulator with XRE-family HTH domain